MENTENIQGTSQTEEKTFTQAELNAIVQKRLGEEKAKYENYEVLKEKAQKYDEIEEQSKSDLEKANERVNALTKELDGMKRADAVRKIREDVASELGVPAHLLTADTKEECVAQAQSILEFAKPNSYPNVPNPGEPTGTAKQTTRDQFANWFNEFNGGK